ncbi:NAD(P)-dependent alcohol dehydrogenase [Flavobacterium sp. HSC-61S13]|uniref:NAD(P)-dependent alcohol dehydrogenase n=1 Tax=Flavobacterium sp. HSC-61S13 TaxID=2910963 RepID=UPI0020A0C182|nr:NAD(P)-dependent alcohol dehydrogenase [Flavobacterium sp. HSC-61S13]MCP1996147.1 propanol-preferring alcohol dehydrogenase [Flavobacterium sp. HSC-61S13]
MKAVRYLGVNDVKIVNDLVKPKPSGDQVLIKIAGAGVCHSDLHVIDHGTVPGPFTLGHENAGYIEEVGESVSGYKKGDAVLVYGPWGCGHCKPCQQSFENYCDHQSERAFGGGLGLDGGMAEYMLVPSSRLLVPIYDLDPVLAAPLTDAALTPYSAIKRSLNKLTPDEYVVVMGIGGLGHTALQILKETTGATVIACDISDDKLNFAKQLGATYVINSKDTDAAEQIKKITGIKKAKVVLDFVGAPSTMELGAQVVSLNGDLTIVGLGGGSLSVASGKIPFGTSVTMPYWGSQAELVEVVALARQGKIHIEIEKFPMDRVLEVYDKMRNGQLKGRAVLIP